MADNVEISIHAPHTGRDAPVTGSAGRTARFQSTRPIRGATHIVHRRVVLIDQFQSTRPIRGATRANFVRKLRIGISIHAPHTGRDGRCGHAGQGERISIHAPHTGRDSPRMRFCPATGISIHAPHTGRDKRGGVPDMGPSTFQSTRPIRGATTLSFPYFFLQKKYFNPRAPYGARHACLAYYDAAMCISIHAPHTGRDHTGWSGPLWWLISIHAPHTGRDSTSGQALR